MERVEIAQAFSKILDDAKMLEKELIELGGENNVYFGPKVVAYAATRNRYSQMERSAKMLIANGNIDKIYFLVEDDVYPNKLPDIIETINVSNQNYFAPYSPNVNSPWTHMAFMRLAFHKLFPDLDRILWLDTDTLIVDDISKLFETPLNEYYYFGAVKENLRYIQYLDIRKVETKETAYDAYPQTEHQDYYNSGVLLENLKLLRESGTGDRLISYINNYRSYYPDQNIINQLCRNRIFTLSHEYNWSYFTGDTGIPRIIHTSCGKPRPEIQLIIDMYEKLSFDDVMNFKNGNRIKPLLSDSSEILEADEIVEANQSGGVHWN